mgnify:CR=1 FL=1
MCSNTKILSVCNISKCYKMYNRPQERLFQIFCANHKKYNKEFWALRDINFEMHRGECIGIIGRNGAGKSTLLQIIAGTIKATSGTVERFGKIAALLELGSGFNPEFTGKENVFLNAAILGLSHKQTEERYEQILDFADIGEFIDQPVKNYSSGMLARLTFAVNSFIDADLLIVDETLSVGDVFFQQKCSLRLKKLMENGTSLLFVSHSTAAVQQLCNKALYLRRGHQITFSDTASAISQYLAEVNQKLCTTKSETPAVVSLKTSPSEKKPLEKKPVVDQMIFTKGSYSSLPYVNICPIPPVFHHTAFFKKMNQGIRYGTGRAKICGVEVLNQDGQPKDSFCTGELIIFRMHVSANENIEKICYNLKVVTSHGVGVVHFSSFERGLKSEFLQKGQNAVIDFIVCNSFGGSQRYFLQAGLTSLANGEIGSHEILDYIESCNVFLSVNRTDYPIWELVDMPCSLKISKEIEKK